MRGATQVHTRSPQNLGKSRRIDYEAGDRAVQLTLPSSTRHLQRTACKV